MGDNVNDDGRAVTTITVNQFMQSLVADTSTTSAPIDLHKLQAQIHMRQSKLNKKMDSITKLADIIR